MGSLGSLKEIIEKNWTVRERPELFCFGLLEEFDIVQILALVAPRPAVLRDASSRVRGELTPLKAWYGTVGGDPQGLTLRTGD